MNAPTTLSIDDLLNGMGGLDAEDIKAEIAVQEKKLARLKTMLAVVEGGAATEPPKRVRKRTKKAAPAADATPVVAPEAAPTT